MNEKDYTHLDDYFNGVLSPTDAQAVRERAAVDVEFGQAFSLMVDMHALPKKAAHRQAVKNTLEAVEKDFFTEKAAEIAPMKAKSNLGRWLAAAASIVLVAGAYWFYSRPGAPEYHQYAQHAPLSLTQRGNAGQSASEAENAFATKHYAEALGRLELLLQNEPDNINAQLYKAICLIEMDKTPGARAVLIPIESGASALKGEARWYIALSYLKEKDYANCKTQLESIVAGADHYQDAQKLLKALN